MYVYVQVTNLTMFLSELNETETITEAGNIANSLADVTSSEEKPIFAADINLAVNIISTLNKYDIYIILLWLLCKYTYILYSVTETVVSNLTADDTLLEVC